MKFKEVLSLLKHKRFLTTFLLGFSSGVPLLLTLRTLQMWLTEANVDLKTIGFFSLATIPGVYKFLWAPLLDRFFIHKIGRRKTWLYISQFFLFLLIFLMGSIEPSSQTAAMALIAVLISFWSATQDVVVDALRSESLATDELGIGATFYTYGYRLAMYMTGAVAIGISTILPWSAVYHLASTLILVGVCGTYLASEPAMISIPQTFKETVIEPFSDILKRKGVWTILIFIVLYKLGDNFSGNMVSSFYVKMKFDKLAIATLAKSLSLPAALLGSLVGGLGVIRFGIYKSLFIFGIFQALSTAGFGLLHIMGQSLWGLGSVVFFEDMTASMGSAAFIALMGKVANKKFTATQYALLSGLSLVPRAFVSAPAGILAEQLGWTQFFMFSALIAIPGLMMIPFMKKFDQEEQFKTQT